MNNRKPILLALAIAVVSVSAFALSSGEFRVARPPGYNCGDISGAYGIKLNGCNANVTLSSCEPGPNDTCDCDGVVNSAGAGCPTVESDDGVWKWIN